MSGTEHIVRNFKTEGARVSLSCGALTAIPIAYPVEPFYWFAILPSVLLLLAARIPTERLILLLAFIIIGIASTLLTNSQNHVSLVRAVPILLATVIVLAGYGVSDRMQFVRAYCVTMAIWAVLVVFAWLSLGISAHGWRAFVYPELRLWGSAWFPDWPNFLAFGMGLAAILAACTLRMHVLSSLCLVGALLTTSRMAVLALALVGLHWVSCLLQRRRGPATLFAGSCLVAVVILANWSEVRLLWHQFNALLDSGLLARLVKFGDRAQIWSVSADFIARNPLLGIGALPLDEHIGLPSSSIHNSYLDVLVRTGILGLIAWLMLFFPSARSIAANKSLVYAFAFFALSAFFNNVLKHPHYMLVYGVLLAGVVRLPDSQARVQPVNSPRRARTV